MACKSTLILFWVLPGTCAGQRIRAALVCTVALVFLPTLSPARKSRYVRKAGSVPPTKSTLNSSLLGRETRRIGKPPVPGTNGMSANVAPDPASSVVNPAANAKFGVLGKEAVADSMWIQNRPWISTQGSYSSRGHGLRGCGRQAPSRARADSKRAKPSLADSLLGCAPMRRQEQHLETWTRDHDFMQKNCEFGIWT